MAEEFRLFIQDPYARECATGKDVVQEHIEEKYNQKISLPLDKLDKAPPESYMSPLRAIIRTLTPHDIISLGTGEMVVDAMTDLVVGGNLNIHAVDNENLEKTMNNAVDKAVRSAEMFGNSIVVQSGESLEIYDATQYYREGDTIEIVYPEIINREDKYVRIKLTKTQNSNTKWRIVETYVIGSDKKRVPKQSFVNIVEFTNNNINHDSVGQSLLTPILNDLVSIDMTTHLYEKNMYYTKPRIHVSDELAELDENGNPILNQKDDVYVMVDALGLSDTTSPYQVTQFNFEQKAYDEKIKNALSRCLSKIGMDNRILAWGNGNIERTATEIRSSDDRMINTIERKRNQYYNSINEVVKLMSKSGQINFTPTSFTTFEQMVQSVVQLKSSQLLSDYNALKLLYPRWSEKQIQEELEKIKTIQENNNEQTNTGTNVSTESIN